MYESTSFTNITYLSQYKGLAKGLSVSSVISAVSQMFPELWVTFSKTHAVFLMILYVGYIEYEIAFLPIWLKRNHPKENIYWGLQEWNRGLRSTMKILQFHLGFSKWALTLFHEVSYLCFYTCTHSLIKDEDVFIFPDALRGWCGS